MPSEFAELQLARAILTAWRDFARVDAEWLRHSGPAGRDSAPRSLLYQESESRLSSTDSAVRLHVSLCAGDEKLHAKPNRGFALWNE